MVILALGFLVVGFRWLVLGRGSLVVGFVVAETENSEHSLALSLLYMWVKLICSLLG